jgi:beta-lactamase regulating signal transducer with metallopeptidase domain
LIPLLVSSTVKTSVIILAALLATALLRKRSAALRHGVLATALACAAILPVLEPAVPAWDVRPATRAAFVPAMSSWASVEPVRHVAPAPASTRRVGALLAPAWVAGVALSLSLLGIGLARMTWLTLRSEPLTRGRWRELADATAREYRLTRHVLLLRSSHPTVLVTWGLLRPRIVLPATAAGWADDRMRIVLAHELAHIRRRDWAVQMGAELLRSVYWFNPLVWIACTRLRRESEHACDDAVLNHGVEAAEYATQLMDLARRFSAGDRTWLLLSPRPEMARPSNLERRIRAMLNDRLDRTPPTRSVRVVIALALSSLMLPLAGF